MAGATSAPSTYPPVTARELLLAWLHLAVLWALAVAKPLFDVLADEPEFFVARGNTSADIVVLALAVTFVPPTVLVLCEALLIPIRYARRALHLVFVGVLIAAIAIQVLEDWVGGPGGVLLAVAVAIGVAGAAAYARTRLVPAVLTVLGPAPLVFAALFLLVSPVSDLVLRGDGEAVAASDLTGSTPVVMVVFDELSGSSLTDRRGGIDASRFPHLAALARDATWYPNATTVADETTQAMPALLSGLRPADGRLPIASDYPLNLFTVLGDRYSMNVEEPATDLCPERLCGSGTRASAPDRLRALADDLSVVSARLLFPEDLGDGLPPVDRTFAGFRRAGRDTGGAAGGFGGVPTEGLEGRPARFERFLAGVRGGERPPGLHFLHIALPHSPWEYLPSGQAYPISGPDIPGLTGDTWSDEARFPIQAEQRYLLQLGFADRLVGRLMQRLREEGLYERSLVIVTADHGISFLPGRGRRIATRGAIAGIANVPLFVKEPGQRSGRVDEGPALTIDVLPTIARTLGTSLHGRVDGRPLPRDGPLSQPLTIHAFVGGEARIPFKQLVRRRDLDAARRLALFGAGNGFAGVFGVGPYPELVGRAVAATPARDPADFRVEFDFRPEYATFVPGSPGVPAFVTGRLSGSATEGEVVAIAINGRVHGVTQSYRHGSEVRMGGMVPSGAFRAGANRVEAFAVEGPPSRPVLANAGRAESQGATLARRGRRSTLVPARGQEIPVEPGVADGYIDTISVDGGRLSVAGWATDGAHGGPVDSVLLFADRRLLQAGRPSAQRDDLTKLFGQEVQPAGYEFSGIGSPKAGTRLRVFAVVDGRASEIKGASSPSVPDGS